MLMNEMQRELDMFEKVCIYHHSHNTILRLKDKFFFLYKDCFIWQEDDE